MMVRTGPLFRPNLPPDPIQTFGLQARAQSRLSTFPGPPVPSNPTCPRPHHNAGHAQKSLAAAPPSDPPRRPGAPESQTLDGEGGTSHPEDGGVWASQTAPVVRKILLPLFFIAVDFLSYLKNLYKYIIL
jgi:hypothetical protein